MCLVVWQRGGVGDEPQGVERMQGIDLSVCDIGDVDVRALVVGDEVVDDGVGRTDDEGNDEGHGFRVEEELAVARAVVRDTVPDGPDLLTRGDVQDHEGDARERECIGAPSGGNSAYVVPRFRSRR